MQRKTTTTDTDNNVDAIVNSPMNEGNKMTFKELSKVNLLLAVLATFILRITPLMQTNRISPWGDDMGAYFAAAKVAGLDWSGVGEIIQYYGQGYYVFFAPLFMITDDPFVIWLSMLLINATIISVFSIVIYSIAVLNCRLPDRIPTVFIVAFCSGTVFLDPRFVRNEEPVFFIVWLCALMLFIASKAGGKEKHLATLGLVLILSWGLFIHTRLEVLIIIIAVVALLYYVFFKVWIISPIVFYPSITICYLVSRRVHAFLATVLYGSRDFSQIANATIDPTSLFRAGLSIEPMIDTTLSNTYNLVFTTYGIAAITITLLAFLVYRVCRRIFVERMRSDKGLVLPGNQLAVMLIFSGCVIATIIGIYIRAADPINSFYIGTGSSSRWFAYLRYYAPYYSPLIIITMGFVYRNADRARKMCMFAIGLFFLLFIYVSIKIIPMVQHSADFIRIGSFNLYLNGFRGTLFGAFGTYVIIASLFSVYYVFLYKRKPLLLMIPVYALVLSISISNVSTPMFNVTTSSDTMDTKYAVLKHIEKAHGLPEEIFTDSENARELQFLLSRYRIVPDLPIEGYADAIFVGTTSDENSQTLMEYGFVLYSFPNDADIWIRGEGMQKSIKSTTDNYGFLVQERPVE